MEVGGGDLRKGPLWSLLVNSDKKEGGYYYSWVQRRGYIIIWRFGCSLDGKRVGLEEFKRIKGVKMKITNRS